MPQPSLERALRHRELLKASRLHRRARNGQRDMGDDLREPRVVDDEVYHILSSEDW